METATCLLENTVQEYQYLLNNTEIPGPCISHLHWDDIRNKLQSEAGWTEEGAKHIANLARNYGSFILRNALALAITLNIEDGKLGL